MVRELKVPADLSSAGIDRDDRRTIQILLRTMAAVVLSRRLTDGQEDQAACGIERSEAPVRRRPRRLPIVLRPRVVTWLTGMRNRMKGPDKLAGSDIPRTYIHRWAFRVVFLPLRTGDDEVPVDNAG